MGWNAGMDAGSAIGAAITYTPDTDGEGAYTISPFTAPRKGVYRFELYGSGGTGGTYAPGGAGGYTDGYLLLDKGQTVYVGAGGTCSAAFVSQGYGANLAQAGTPLLIAGAGGGGGTFNTHSDYTSYGSGGGNGGGAAGADAANGGKGGSQSGGGAAGGSYAARGSAGSYGTGGAGVYVTAQGGAWAQGGRGGDGYYGGGSGYSVASHNSGTDDTSSYAFDGGGGSGFVRNSSLTILGKTYASATAQGGGAGSGQRGSVRVTYAARAALPVVFDGIQLERLVFNGTQAEGLAYNGTIIFMRRGWRWLLEQTMRLLRRDGSSARRMRSLTASI